MLANIFDATANNYEFVKHVAMFVFEWIAIILSKILENLCFINVNIKKNDSSSTLSEQFRIFIF